MKCKKLWSPIVAAGLALCLAVVLIAAALAQSKQAANPGSYHGELDFPIS